VESVLKGSPAAPDALLLAAQIEEDRMILASSEALDGQALEHARRSTARLDSLIAGGRASSDQAQQAALAYLNIGLAHMNGHRYEDAIRYARRSIDLGRSSGLEQPYLAGALSLEANAMRYSGDLEGALRSIVEARKLAEGATFSSDTSRAVILYAILWRQGGILGEEDSLGLGRPSDAVEPLEKAFDLVEQQAAKDPNDAASRDRVASAGRLLGDNLAAQDPQRALAVYDQTLRRVREIPNNVRARRDEALLLAHSSYVLRRLHRAQEAGEQIDAALALLRATHDYPATKVVLGETVHFVMSALADQADETGHRERALAIYRELLDEVVAGKPEPENDLRQAKDISRIYGALSRLYRQSGEAAQADLLDNRRRELWQAWSRKLPHSSFVTRRLAGIPDQAR
jgi:tetratricopeptide (TPR) repeat protein